MIESIQVIASAPTQHSMFFEVGSDVVGKGVIGEIVQLPNSEGYDSNDFAIYNTKNQLLFSVVNCSCIVTHTFFPTLGEKNET